MDDVAGRLRQQVKDDHARGCQGRQYACSCGYDLSTEGLLEMAADEIDRLHTADTMAKYWRGQYDLLHAHIEKIRAAVALASEERNCDARR